jgi:hypothetical protein
MRTIRVDAGHWKTDLDIYKGILPAIGAPKFHGENINALTDSIIYGGINAARPPYRFCIVNTQNLPSDV